MSIGSHAGNAAAAYQEQDIRTADPMTLVARVFEIALVQVARARAALASGQIAAKGVAVQRIVRCLGVLQASLDLDRGGEVAKNLDRLYDYLVRRASEGHRRNDDAAFAEVARHLGELAAAWREAAQHQASAPTSQAAAASR